MAEECHDLALVQLEVEVVDGHLGGAAVLVDPPETHDAEALLEALLEAGVDVQGMDCVLCRKTRKVTIYFCFRSRGFVPPLLADRKTRV